MTRFDDIPTQPISPRPNKGAIAPGLRQNGFTLVEVIVAVLILAILGSLSFVGIARIVNGFFFASRNAALSQKAELALLKLEKELSVLCVPPAAGCQTPTASSSSLSFTSYRGSATATSHVLSWDGNGSHALMFDNDALIGGSVNDYISFSLTYFNSYSDPTPKTAWSSNIRIIQIQLSIRGADNNMHTFTERVRPRNL